MTTCYACDLPSISKEHVPPRLLFPAQKDTVENRDLRVKLITVPSCDTHNSEKSKDDEYLLWVLSTNLCANPVAIQQAKTKLVRSFRRKPALGNSILSTMRDVTVTDSSTGAVHDTAMGDLDGARFLRSLELVARGLHFHHFGTQWLGPLHVHADFVNHRGIPNGGEVDEARRILFQDANTLFAAVARHGENPDVFWFQVLKPEHTWALMMRFAFYGGCTVTVFFGEPQRSKA